MVLAWFCPVGLVCDGNSKRLGLPYFGIQTSQMLSFLASVTSGVKPVLACSLLGDFLLTV